MLKFVILLAVAVCALGATIPEGMLPELDGRIIGGADTTITSFPWQISIERSGSHYCGGSIYSNSVIITAAHCLLDATSSSLMVRAGSTYHNSGGVFIQVAAFIIHEDYDPVTKVNDVAVVRLSASLTYSSSIKNIALATTAPATGAAAVVTGWGSTNYIYSTMPTILQEVEVNIIGLAECSTFTYGYHNDLKSSMICASAPGKDACQGDSGGPLVSGGVLVGVVSWGYGCAWNKFPGVYADVAHLRSWIISAARTV